MAAKPKSASAPKADRFRLSSVLSGAVHSLVSMVTTYGQTSFNGRQFSSKVYATPTDCVTRSSIVWGVASATLGSISAMPGWR